LSIDAPDMQDESSETRTRHKRKDGRRSHGKAKLLTLDRLDKRTAAGQHALALVRAFEADLGGADRLSEGAKQLIRRVAVLSAYIESVEVKWLRGEQIELLDLLAATNTQRRLIQDLGAATRQARDITPLRERLALEAEEAA
jgi:hypothetical protein